VNIKQQLWSRKGKPKLPRKAGEKGITRQKRGIGVEQVLKQNGLKSKRRGKRRRKIRSRGYEGGEREPNSWKRNIKRNPGVAGKV